MNDYNENQIFTEDSFTYKSGEIIEFVECKFEGIDFSPYNVSRNKFFDCEFTNCNLSNVSLKSATLRNISFKASKLIGINWAEASALVNPSFKDCALDYGVFQGMNLKGATFFDCNMTEVDFYGANLEKAILCGSRLLGATFNSSNLYGTDFRGALDYSVNIRETKIAKAKFSMPEAISLLSALEIEVDY
ncbi:MAG: pentapeptide repeat-containing protein [Bdellovibrionales bacterium]|nr:pentapeptide repeat-containing protein [Bdellovibrionales bacterium]